MISGIGAGAAAPFSGAAAPEKDSAAGTGGETGAAESDTSGSCRKEGTGFCSASAGTSWVETGSEGETEAAGSSDFPVKI